MKTNSKLKFFLCITVYFHLTKSAESNESIIMNLYYSEETNFTTNISDKRDENAIANALYNKSYEKIGWDYLSISSYTNKDNKYNDSKKAYAMGYLEGVLTRDRIYAHYTNFKNYFLARFQSKFINAFYNIFTQNINYMKNKSIEYMDKEPYWEHIYYIYQQLLGLYEGYASVAENGKEIEFKHFLALVGLPDAKDIAHYLTRPRFEQMTPKELERYLILDSQCSAFVKLSKDSSDIWFGHNTWTYYIFMIRIFKEYRFVSNKGHEKSTTSVFSSYPASLSSMDEFYYLNSNLLVMGTSISILKADLYDLFTYKSILIWARQTVANRLSSSSKEWTEIFKKENSGTNNDQIMILDMNKINLKSKILENEALMIIEQMPKYTESKDVTEYLRNGYWPSFNVPFIDKIYKDLGFIVEGNENVRYTQAPRKKIFERDQININSIEDFKKFMRYNDYKNDNLSLGNPANTIAAREDLYSDTPKCHGAIDAKFVSVKELLEKKNIIHIISGPTNDQQETFSWLNTACEGANLGNVSHIGQNNVWNFPWIDYSIQLINTNSDNNSEEPTKNKTYKYWIIGASALIVLAVIIIVLAFVFRKKMGKINKDINKISFSEGETDDKQKDNLLTDEN